MANILTTVGEFKLADNDIELFGESVRQELFDVASRGFAHAPVGPLVNVTADQELTDSELLSLIDAWCRRFGGEIADSDGVTLPGAPEPAHDAATQVDEQADFISDSVALANPWHDELGRFAEKGTGRIGASGVPLAYTADALTPKQEAADVAFAEEHGNERPSGDGDCFPAAYHSAMDEGGVVVHGVVRGQGEVAGMYFDHAWAEVEGDLIPGVPAEARVHVTVIDRSNGNDVSMPAVAYYALGGITEDRVRRYELKKYHELILEAGHYGPFEDIEIPDG